LTSFTPFPLLAQQNDPVDEHIHFTLYFKKFLGPSIVVTTSSAFVLRATLKYQPSTLSIDYSYIYGEEDTVYYYSSDFESENNYWNNGTY